MVFGLILFILLGLALGYAVPGPSAYFGLLVPVIFAALTAFNQGVDAALILELVVALVVMMAAIVVGRLLDRHFTRRRQQAEGERA